MSTSVVALDEGIQGNSFDEEVGRKIDLSGQIVPIRVADPILGTTDLCATVRQRSDQPGPAPTGPVTA